MIFGQGGWSPFGFSPGSTEQPGGLFSGGGGGMVPPAMAPQPPQIPSAMGEISPEFISALQQYQQSLSDNEAQAMKARNLGVGGSILAGLFTDNPLSGLGEMGRHQQQLATAKDRTAQGNLAVAQSEESARRSAGDRDYREYTAKRGEYEYDQGAPLRDLKEMEAESRNARRKELIRKSQDKDAKEQLDEQFLNYMTGKTPEEQAHWYEEKAGVGLTDWEQERIRQGDASLELRDKYQQQQLAARELNSEHKWLGHVNRRFKEILAEVPEMQPGESQPNPFNPDAPPLPAEPTEVPYEQRQEATWDIEFKSPSMGPVLEMKSIVDRAPGLTPDERLAEREAFFAKYADSTELWNRYMGWRGDNP